MNTVGDFIVLLVKDNKFDLIHKLISLKLQNTDSCTNLLKVCISDDDPTFIELLVKYGFDLNNTFFVTMASPEINVIRYALWCQKYVIATELLKYGANIDSLSQFKRTPLMTAILNGRIDTIQYILKNNPNKEMYDDFGKSALYYSVTDDKLPIAQLLLDYGMVIDDKVIQLIQNPDNESKVLVKKYYEESQTKKTASVGLKECVNDVGQVCNIPDYPVIKLYFNKGTVPEKINTKKISGPTKIERIVDGKWVKDSINFDLTLIQYIDAGGSAECHVIPAGTYFKEDTPIRFDILIYG